MTRTFAIASIFRAPTGNLVSRTLNALVAADRRYRERCHLTRMSDADLADIGLTRDDLHKL
ncbi:MAG: DUF1127 domain-containing protein [Pseudomonadota bacterium]